MTLQLEVPSADKYVAVLESSHVFPLEIWLLCHFICSLFLGLQLCAYLYTKCIFSTFFLPVVLLIFCLNLCNHGLAEYSHQIGHLILF